MATCFDKTTKLKFRNPDEPSYIRFGGIRDKDPEAGIRSGQLKLPGCAIHCFLSRMDNCSSDLSTEVAALFEPSVQSIIEAIDKQRSNAYKPVAVCHRLVFHTIGFANQF